MSPVNKLCQVQVAENYGSELEIPEPTDLTASGFIVFSNKKLRDTESEGGVQ